MLLNAAAQGGCHDLCTRASRTRKEEVCREPHQKRCCARDGGSLALQRRPTGAGAKPPGAALAEDCRGERSGKRRGSTASGGDQEDVPEPLRRMTGGACAVEASKETETASKPGALGTPSGMSLADTRVLARRCPA